jgi:hypothetical protein
MVWQQTKPIKSDRNVRRTVRGPHAEWRLLLHSLLAADHRRKRIARYAEESERYDAKVQA